MREAIRIAVENVKNHAGGPFGAVVVKDGKIIASSGNTVVPSNDPTAHAEVNAIRAACQALETHQLTGCEIYTSCDQLRTLPHVPGCHLLGSPGTGVLRLHER